MIVMSFWKISPNNISARRSQMGKAHVRKGLFVSVQKSSQRVNGKVECIYRWAILDLDKAKRPSGRAVPLSHGYESLLETACAAADAALIDLGVKLLDSKLELML